MVSNNYNGDGLVSQVTYPNSVKQFSYYRNGMLARASDEQGAITNTIDFANRLVATTGTTPSSTVTYAYYPAGQVSNMTSVAGSVAYGLDEADRLSSLTAAPRSMGPMKFNWAYNANNGLVQSVTSTNSGLCVAYGYNGMDQVTNITWRNTASNVVKSFAYAYSPAGMITNVTLEDGSRLGYSLDDLDRLVGEQRIGPDGLAVYDNRYGFDNVGNRTQKISGGTTVNYTYSNGCNRLLGWSAVLTNNYFGVTRLDVAGNASSAIATNPASLNWVSNQMAAVSTVNGSNFWRYSLPLGVGSQQVVAAAADAAGRVGYATNRVTVMVVTNGTYTLDGAGCVNSMGYSGSNYSRTLTLGWDGQYRLTSVATNGVAIESYTYDVLGRRVTVPSSDGSIATVTDTVTNWVCGKNWSSSQGSTLASLYCLNQPDGGDLTNRTSRDLRQTTCTVTFRMQALSTNEYGAGEIAVYLSDGAGNEVCEGTAYAERAPVTQWQTNTFAFTVDATHSWSNIIFRPWASGLTYLKVDQATVTVQDANSHVVYDGQQTVADVDLTGGVKRAYVNGPGIDNILAMVTYSNGTPQSYYFIKDHLGSVHAVVNSSGNIVESYRYDAWGRVLGVYDGQGTPLTQSAIGNRFLWQGREYSWATGLYYFRARWYDPVTGRWLSNDPIGISGGLNQYVFCGNNPVNFRDPLGRCRERPARPIWPESMSLEHFRELTVGAAERPVLFALSYTSGMAGATLVEAAVSPLRATDLIADTDIMRSIDMDRNTTWEVVHDELTSAEYFAPLMELGRKK